MKLKSNLVLFCGLACSGKSRIANHLYRTLINKGISVEKIELDIYIKNNFPKKKFIFDIEQRLKLDKIIAENLRNKMQDDKVFIIDAGSPFTAGRFIYQQIFPNTLIVLVDTPLHICFLRDIKRSLRKKSPIKNWIYIKAIISKLFGQNKNLLQGISIPFEKPDNAIVIKSKESTQSASKKIVKSII